MDHKEIKKLFDSEKGWTTQFEIDGIKYGGNTPVLANDPRLLWHIEQAGGIKGKSVLELGPLEGAHTKTMIDKGAGRVIAIEGNADCYRRCRIVEAALDFPTFWGEFRNSDFTVSIPALAAEGMRFDIVSAAGVLYHQLNPAQLIMDMAMITDTIFVWTHVANKTHPLGGEASITSMGKTYRGRINNYGRGKGPGYCAGLNEKAFWMYPEDMKCCFSDAGFTLTIKEHGNHINGDYMLFIAKR